MATKAGTYRNGYIKIGNTDLSNHCISLHGDVSTPGVSQDGFGDAMTYQAPGVPTRTLTARFLNDFAAASVFATLNPLKSGALHVVQWRNDAGIASALNPTHSGLYFISSITGLEGGERGSNTEVNVTWMPAGIEMEVIA